VDRRIADIDIVSGLELDMEGGQFWGLLGPNGIGKTTLLKCLAGLSTPDSGEISLNGCEITGMPRRSLARNIGMLQQHTVYVFDSMVLQTVLTGRHPHLGYWEREGPEDMHKAMSALRAVDLEGFSERSVTGLSGGEARRLAFAALLVQEPRIMLLDEPSNHLDLKHQVQIMSMIRAETRREGRMALAALHDINLAARFCTHVLMLFGSGEWHAGPCEEMLNESSLERLYNCPVEKIQGRHGSRYYPAGD
jgi:iron complex transport system ATP-binding protein